MASNFNMIFASASLLLALICSYGIMSTEGRLLTKTESHEKCGNRATLTESGNENIINSRRNILEHEAEATNSAGGSPPSPTPSADVSSRSPPAPAVPSLSVDDTDDFRPTVPGHSPGAGHSLGPLSEAPN